MTASSEPLGLLLFAHGARDAAWAQPFEAVLAQVRAQAPTHPAELAFLEFMSPNMVEAGARLVAQGCRRIRVVPLFLGAGGHVRKDVPALLDQLRVLHPGLALDLQPAAGASPEVVQALARTALSGLSGLPGREPHAD